MIPAIVCVAAFVIGWAVSHFNYYRLIAKMQKNIHYLIERAEDEYVRLVDQEVDAKHLKDTYIKGYRACMREVDSLLIKLW